MRNLVLSLVSASLLFFVVRRTCAQELLVAADLGFEVWLVNEAAIPGYESEFYATTLQFRAEDPSGLLVTFDDIDLDGTLHQVWTPSRASFEPTPNVYHWKQFLDLQELQLLDSHVVVPIEWMAGAGLSRPEESNDLSLRRILIQSPDVPEPFEFGSGFGSIVMNGVFFICCNEEQSSLVEWAYLVRPCEPTPEENKPLTLSGSVLGVGIGTGSPDYLWPTFDHLQIPDQTHMQAAGISGVCQPVPEPVFSHSLFALTVLCGLRFMPSRTATCAELNRCAR